MEECVGKDKIACATRVILPRNVSVKTKTENIKQ